MFSHLRILRKTLAIPVSNGVESSHLKSYLYIAFFSTCVMAFINFVMPYLLTEFLQVPKEMQGSVTGNQVFWNEVVIIATIGGIGILSDKLGRSVIYTLGFTVVGIAYLLFPLVSNVTELTWVRCFFAFGAACITAMLATVMGDYPTNEARGKIAAFAGVLTGLGILMMVTILSKLPAWFQAFTVNAKEAGSWSFIVISIICFHAAIVAFIGLKPGATENANSTSFKDLAKQGIKAARKPGILVAYLSSFVSRGDLAIVGTFLSLWVVQDGISHGMETPKALAYAGMIFGISQTAALFWGPVMGILCDRFDRMLCVVIALFLAALGYCSIGLVTDTTSAGMIVACILVGIGEISGVIASQSLIGQEAPEKSRGSVVGVFGFAGAIGILIATKTGGYLFDAVRPSAPFVAMGVVNGMICAYALYVYLRGRKKSMRSDQLGSLATVK